MKSVAIFGATGYTGFELIRLLLSHRWARIEVLSSEQYSSQPLEQAFPPFKGKLGGVLFGKMEHLLPAEFDVATLLSARRRARLRASPSSVLTRTR